MGPRGSAASGPGWQAAAAWLTLVVQAVIFGADTWQTRLPAQTLSVHLCILSAFRLVMVCSCLFDRYRIYVPRVCSSCVRSGARARNRIVPRPEGIPRRATTHNDGLRTVDAGGGKDPLENRIQN